MKNKLFNKKTSMKIDEVEIQDYIDNSKKKTGFLVKRDIDIVKDLFTCLGIPFIQADEEAETLGCYLQNKGICDCLISLDSDCVAYGVDYFIIDMSQNGACTLFDVNELSNLLKLSKTQIRDLCIMCQCDYNSNGGGIEGVGPTKAIRLLILYKDIETILKNGYKEDQLNYERCREIFQSKYPEQDILFQNMKWSKQIDIEKFEEFIKTNNIPMNMGDINALWC